MTLDQPIQFEPLFMERVWGGRRLEQLFGKRLPPGVRVGESWEIVDREEAQSVVHQGALKGTTLHTLWTERRSEIFGSNAPDSARFPLLFKLLDAQERLSVQVHPPASVAPQLKGEPKTEMWYVAEAQTDADIYAGLNKGVSRDDFESALQTGLVGGELNRLEVKTGDAILIPSGRVHAIGAGNVIVEVQQNSDTTYRVFDWNRLGLDGKARTLHLEESLQSIDFEDAAPELARPAGELIVECEYFRVERWNLTGPREGVAKGGFAIFAVLSGTVSCGSAKFSTGDFFLLPANLADRTIVPANGAATALRTTIPA